MHSFIIIIKYKLNYVYLERNSRGLIKIFFNNDANAFCEQRVVCYTGSYIQ